MANLRCCIDRTFPGDQLLVVPEDPLPKSGTPNYTVLQDSNPRFCIEIKSPWNIGTSDIVKEYNSGQNPIILHAIRQVFGYMGHAELRYSVLSTYEKTWFLYRPVDNPGMLLISNCIQRASSVPTLLHCFLFMVCLSSDGNHFSPNPPPSPSPPPPPHSDSEPSECDNYDEDPSYDPEDNDTEPSEGSSSYNNENNRSRTWRQRGTQKGCRGNVEQFNWGDFSITNELGQGRCGTVYEAIFHHDRVAVKIADAWKYPAIEEEMMHEAKMYMRLKKLQGISIPKLKGFGYTAGGLLALATEISGSPIRIENLRDEERDGIIKALSSLHEHGVLHGDIRPSNILVQYECGKVNFKLIDLAFSQLISKREEARREMDTMKKVLGWKGRAKSRGKRGDTVHEVGVAIDC